jgi:hypothetical protein
MTKTFTIGLKNPSDIILNEQMCYLDHKTNEFTYVDIYGVVQKSKEINVQKAKVKILPISASNLFYKIEITDTDSDANKTKKKAEIEFIKRWPLVAKAGHNNAIDCFPSDNHQAEFANVFKADKKALLSTDVQMYSYRDEEEIKQSKVGDLHKLRKTNSLLGSILPKDEGGDETVVNNVMYMLGLNPIGKDIADKETNIYDFVNNSNKHDEFAKIIERRSYDDPATLAVHAGIACYIITQNDSKYYQFEGTSISKEIQDVALHFRQNKSDWTNLRNELKLRGVEVPEEIGEKAVKASATKPSEKKAAIAGKDEIDV